jgi:hypothetical protein
MAEQASTKKKYNVLSKVHHVDPDGKKNDKQVFLKGEKIALAEDHAEPLLARKVIEAAK